MKFWPFKRKAPGDVVQIDRPQSITDIVMSDAVRVTNYLASGGEIVDLSNKERLPNDGFASDQELMTPFNQAHKGTKQGLASLAKGDRR